MPVKKIAIIGPEASGKTVLAAWLSEYFDGRFVPEFAREYLAGKNSAYTFDDLYQIAKGQMRQEDLAFVEFSNINGNGYLFIDTELNVVRVWSEIAFNRCDNRILTELSLRHYDHFLLTFPDLPWEPDPLREYPDPSDRLRHFHYYLDAMVHQHIPFTVIRGEGEERFKIAEKAVSGLFQ